MKICQLTSIETVLSFWKIIPCFSMLVMGCPALAQVQQAWVAKYNNGVPNSTNQAVKMVLDSSGNIYIAGFSENTNDELGYVTITYRPSGNQVWATRFDSTNYPQASPTSMVLDPSNNVIVTGYGATVKYATNGAQLWTVPLGAKPGLVAVDSSDTIYPTAAVAVDAAANVYVTGFGTNFNTEKLSPNGSNIWVVTYKDVGPTISQAIMVDSQTNIYVTGADTWLYYGDPGGATLSSSQLLVCKYDSAGSFIWSAVYHTCCAEEPVSIAGAGLDNANNIYVFSDVYLDPLSSGL